MPLARSPPKTSPSTRSRSRSQSNRKKTENENQTENETGRSTRSQTEETEGTVTTRHNTPFPPPPQNPSSFILPPPLHPNRNPPHLNPSSRNNENPDTEDSDPADRTISLGPRRRRETVYHSRSSSDDMADPLADRVKELNSKHDNVHKFVTKIEPLALDGSNLARWKIRTERAIFDMTGVSNYWDTKNVDQENPVKMAIDRCAGRVINTTIAEELQDMTYKHTLAHIALHSLEEMFHQGGRTAQYVIFRRMMLRQFNPASTDLMTFVNEMLTDFEKLKSAGFKWDEEVVKGMVLQLCSPTTGEYGMDIVNGILDARYRTDKSSFTLSEVRSTFQNVIATRKAINENKPNVQALTSSFQKMNPSKWSKPRPSYPVSSSSSYPVSSSSSSYHNPSQSSYQASGRQPRLHGPTPPPALFPNTKAREATENKPIPPSRSSCDEVHKNIWQCFHCESFGHGKLNCPQFLRFQTQTAPHFNDWVKCTNNIFYTRKSMFGSATYGVPDIKARHAQLDVSPAPSGPSQVSASTVAWSAEGNSQDETPTEYFLDSGATHHVSNALSSLISYEKLSTPIKLKTAAYGDNAYIVGRGSLRVKTSDGSNFDITDVYYSPQATNTLISQAALVEQGAKLWFWGKDMIIRLGNNKSIVASYSDRKWLINAMKSVICEEQKPERIGKVEVLSAEKDVDIAYLWHRRFGHVNMKRICQLCNGQLGLGLPKSLPASSFTCEDCLTCKSTRQRKLGRSERELGLLDVIVSDVMGPFPEDVNGNRFTVTFRDVATTFSDIVILKNKSDVPEAFTRVINHWERETGFKVKHVRTDCGGEYIKTTFSNWLKGKGIVHEHSNPYEPKQNGVAERLNRTISEMGRTMLAASHLPQTFWSFAYLTACYLHNRLPNSLTGNRTPYELFYGRKPQLDIIRTFGSTAFIHRHEAQRHGKLDDRGRRCVMIGYVDGGKGWLFYDPGSKVLLKTGIAVFPYEDKFVHSSPEEPKATTSESLNKILNDPPKKGSLEFIVNALTLGDFSGENKVLEEDAQTEKTTSQINLSACLDEPQNFTAAMKDKYAEHWKEAITIELTAMEEMGVWKVVDRPDNVNTLGLKWVFKFKQLDSSGEPIKFKARLVAQGFNQREGIDYDETFAPTACVASLHFILTLAARMGWEVHSFDVTAAYLHSDITNKIYFKLPPGCMTEARKANKILEVVKALYGTKQGARCWWKHFEKILIKLGFKPSQFDQSLYVCRRGDEVCIVWLHVDDGAVTGSSVELLREISAALVKDLKIRWSETLDCIIGIDVKRLEDGSFELSQAGLTNKIINTFLDTPGKQSTPLNSSNLPTSPTDEEEAVDKTSYLSAIGCLNYLAIATRPDLTYATNFLARFSARPTKQHWDAIQGIMRYLKTTGCTKLKLKPIKGEVKTGLHTYVDANWGGEYSRSVHGFVTFFLGCPLSWTSKRQGCVATSTCHAEYMALGTAAREAVWLRNLVSDVIGAMGPVSLFCDNTSAIHVSKDNSSNKRTRHTDREFYYINEQIFKGTVTLHWVDTKHQKADILTKALGPQLFDAGRKNLNLE